MLKISGLTFTKKIDGLRTVCGDGCYGAIDGCVVDTIITDISQDGRVNCSHVLTLTALLYLALCTFKSKLKIIF